MSAAEPSHDAVDPVPLEPWVRFRAPEPCEVEDLDAILDRADRAGIDPQWVLIALGQTLESIRPEPSADPVARDDAPPR
jgi:hypothetical protein